MMLHHYGLNARGRRRQRRHTTRRGGSFKQKSGLSLGSCYIAQCSPKETACESPKERGTKRKALGIDGRSARFLCAVSILLHRDSPFLRGGSSSDACIDRNRQECPGPFQVPF